MIVLGLALKCSILSNKEMQKQGNVKINRNVGGNSALTIEVGVET